MSYTHLSLEERYYIELERKMGAPMNKIAAVLGRSQFHAVTEIRP